jgi:hypothetical protein
MELHCHALEGLEGLKYHECQVGEVQITDDMVVVLGQFGVLLEILCRVR